MESSFRCFRSTVGIVSIAGTLLTLSVAILADPTTFIPEAVKKFLILVSLLLTFEYIITVWEWSRYKPVRGVVDDESLPKLSITIPTYNESYFVRNSIRSVFLSDYPKSKIELILVDDGSSDDTWSHITAAGLEASHAGVSWRQVQHSINMGKRQAIRTAFLAARGEIIVSLDSDSVLETSTLRNLVSPFMQDQGIGGVAGHLTALNVPEPGVHRFSGLIPRVLDILFDHGGNIPRTAQSAVGFVTILPGALSAYRYAAVRDHIDGLCSRTFLGKPLKHGEDVELTYFMLKDGWKTVYQSNAVVHTTAPECPKKAFLMYTRWERSSYVFLAMGYLGLSLGEARKAVSRLLRVPFRRDLQALVDLDTEKQIFGADLFDNREGSLYPLLNLTCISFGNLFLVTISFTTTANLVVHPANALLFIPMLLLFSAWKSLLSIPDALEDEAPEKDEVGGVYIYSRAARLAARLQYACLALVLQMFYVSWSSAVALLTIRSQSWLTR